MGKFISMNKVKILYPLGRLGKDAIHIVGGKAAHLGELIKYKIPIPEGFVLSTSAFERFLNRSQYNRKIRGILDKQISLTEIISTSQTLHDYIMKTEITAELKDVIINQFEALQTTNPEKFNVAVRSSANIEDLSKTSFAGQADTYLCVRTVEDLLEKIKKCWASLYSASALMYIQQMIKVPLNLVSMGVIIQKMVNSEVSGVMFTANVVTKDKNQVLINATCGFGECIADGVVEPDSIVVDKSTLRVVKTRLGTKVKKSVQNPKADGTILVETPQAQQKSICLSDKQIKDLVNYGIQIEQIFEGAPQDIEWAIEKGAIKILQSRNITHLE